MGEPLVAIPPGGWTTDDLDQLPVSNYRYELTDGALTVSPSRSNLHQMICVHLGTRLEQLVPRQYAVAAAVDIWFTPTLTRVPDVLVVSSSEPGRHWFAPDEVVVAAEVESPGNHVEDRTTKPAIYARFGIPHYWRIDPQTLTATIYTLDRGADAYTVGAPRDRLEVSDPFPVDLAIVDLLPRWAKP